MRLLLISSSNVHGHGYLDHAAGELKSYSLKRVAFVPFALADHVGYTEKVRERLGRLSIHVHQVEGPHDLAKADALFIGGGNTFRLLKALYERELIAAIAEKVRGDSLLYIGSSAGTNVAAPTIRTTNDMPIVEPPSLSALKLVPFQINPHYLDPDPSSTHKGETREERLLQYLEENSVPVVGLREAAMLRIENGTTTLVGQAGARIFKRGEAPFEVEPGTILDPLLK